MPSASRRFLLALGLLVALAAVRYAWTVGISFINDDFLFLERARRSSFAANWSGDDALGNVYRPLTRNVYFWIGLRLLGLEPAPYHVVNLALYAAGLVLLALVARRLVAGASGFAASSALARGAGLLAALLFALHPAAGTPASWVCGVQDLLAVDLALAALLAHLDGRRGLYVLFYAGALLSKETAAFLFPLVFLWDVWVEGVPARRALQRQIPVATLFAAWLALNPWLPWNSLGRTIHSPEPGRASLFGRFDPETMWVTLRALFLVEPVAEFNWPYGLAATVGQVLLAALVLAIALDLLAGGGEDRAPRARPAAAGERRWRSAFLGASVFAVLWSLSAIAPLITVISHFVYYAYYPALGLSLLLAGLVAAAYRRPARGLRLAAGFLAAVATLVLLAGAALVHPPALCDAHNIRRASAHLENFRADLRRHRPSFPESARVYFWNIPPWIGFQLADGPALRVWYGDPTLSGHFLSAYAPAPGRPTFFFGHDDAMHLVEIVRGLPDPALAAPPPIYQAAHTDLGSTLAAAGEPADALVEWRKVLQVDATFSDAAANLGMTLCRLERYDEAVPVLELAARLEPAAADVRLDLGRALLASGRHRDALAALEASLALAPDQPGRDRINAAIATIRAEIARGR
jgi:tetratricopeptide (TPR) repeat protein